MRGTRVAIIALLALTGACHRGIGTAAQVSACRPATAAPTMTVADLEGLAGSYDLVVIANSGARSGAAAAARLELRPQAAGLVRDTARRDVTMDALNPLIGSTDLSPEDVGASRMGDPASRDAAAPGVGLYVAVERPSTVRAAVMRIGSLSNIRGTLQPFDAAYFSIRVTRIDANGFDGEWASGTGTSQAGGHACARRRA